MTRVDEDVEKLEPPDIPGGKVTQCSSKKNSFADSQKIQYRVTV